MTRRNPPAKWVLPDVVNPPDRICYKIEVPNNLYHKAAFFGALLDLASAYKWSDDPAHTAKDVALVWRQIVDDLMVQDCEPAPPTVIGGGAEGGDENMIRQNPSNPCELQTSINGTDWCTFADFSLCIPAGSQPGGGVPQPGPGGGSECYQGALDAKGLWLAPVVVSTGDVLEVQNATGAGYDGSVSLRWYCPTGQTFFAGSCVNVPQTDPGDPLNTVGHMRLIWNIAGVFYDAMAGPVTVPGGVTDAQAILQVNDPVLADNSGTYQFSVCVTNNGAATWSSDFNFVLSPYSGIVTISFGHWTAGSGVEGDNNGANQLFTFVVDLAMSAVTIESATMIYSAGGGSGASQSTQFSTNAGLYGTPGVPGSGSNLTYQVIATAAGATALEGAIGSGTTNAQVTLKHLIVTGLGAKPVGWP